MKVKAQMTNAKIVSALNAIIIVLIVVMLSFEGFLLTSAQEDVPPQEPAADAEEAAESPKDVSGICEQRIKDFLSAKQVEFGEFINAHFRSETPTSALIPIAVERYHQYRDEIRSEIQRFAPEPGRLGARVTNEIPNCKKVMEDEFRITKELLRQHILANAYAKKSTRLIDKYTQINEKLSELNFTLAQMYGYFSAFSQKLPCYAKKCIQG